MFIFNLGTIIAYTIFKCLVVIKKRISEIRYVENL